MGPLWDWTSTLVCAVIVSTPPIRREPPRAQQQRHVVVPIVVEFEHHFDCARSSWSCAHSTPVSKIFFSSSANGGK